MWQYLERLRLANEGKLEPPPQHPMFPPFGLATCHSEPIEISKQRHWQQAAQAAALDPAASWGRIHDGLARALNEIRRS